MKQFKAEESPTVLSKLDKTVEPKETHGLPTIEKTTETVNTRKEIDSETFSESFNESGVEKIDTRKIASENLYRKCTVSINLPTTHIAHMLYQKQC